MDREQKRGVYIILFAIGIIGIFTFLTQKTAEEMKRDDIVQQKYDGLRVGIVYDGDFKSALIKQTKDITIYEIGRRLNYKYIAVRNDSIIAIADKWFVDQQFKKGDDGDLLAGFLLGKFIF